MMNQKIDWRECNLRKLVKPARVDENLIKSLIDSAGSNLSVVKSINQNDLSYSSIVVLAYDSLRMLLEALAIKNGYKIYNHECFTAFLKEIIQRNDLAEKFDPIRLIRNGINYYGKKLNKNEFDLAYNDVLFLIPIIKNLVLKK